MGAGKPASGDFDAGEHVGSVTFVGMVVRTIGIKILLAARHVVSGAARSNWQTPTRLVVMLSAVVALGACAASETGTSGGSNNSGAVVATPAAERNQNMSTAEMPGTEPSTDIDALGRLITLPRRPTAAIWRRVRKGSNTRSDVPGPTDYELQAVLTFSNEDAENIVKEAAARERPGDVGTIKKLDWFPAEVKENLIEEPNSDEYRFKGETYDAGAFAKSPLTHGYFVRVGRTPRFYLYLYTM